MEIKTNCIVEFTYSMLDDNGEILANTQPQATAVLHGQGQVIRGVEQALTGHQAGDRFTVTVSPAQGYGERREDWTQRVSKKYFADAKRLKPGVVTQLQTEHGSRPVTVIKTGAKVVDVDLNHPHAGMTLHFDIEVTDVRTATAEELSHGHAHGAHGAHH